MKQALSCTVIPAQAGIQLIKNHRVAGQHGFVCSAVFLSCWIPVCAGMTVS